MSSGQKALLDLGKSHNMHCELTLLDEGVRIFCKRPFPPLGICRVSHVSERERERARARARARKGGGREARGTDIVTSLCRLGPLDMQWKERERDERRKGIEKDGMAHGSVHDG